MSPEVALEQSMYIANAFACILLGVNITLSILSIYFLVKQRKTRPHSLLYASYSLLMVVLFSIGLGTTLLLGQFMWINHRNVPGGPAAYFAANSDIWFTTFGTAATVTVIFMSDALMLYRCYVIMGSDSRFVVFPTIVFLASTAFGILSTIASAQKFIYSGNPAVFGTAWVALSVAYNGIVTTMICVKLFYANRRMKVLVSSDYVGVYTGVIAIVVESALPYALSGIALAAVFNNTDLSFGFSTAWAGLAVISPHLIILRVSMGIAWSKDTLTQAATQPIRFKQALSDPQFHSDFAGGEPFEEPKFETNDSLNTPTLA